jgi:hypothetical protein
MREVLFKNMTSLQSKKKDTLLQEIFEKDGVLAKTERRYFYFIKEIAYVDSDKSMEEWVSEKNLAEPAKKRHFYIMKEHSDTSGTDKLVCKVAGTFYAIVGRMVYTIAFLHAFKVRFAKVAGAL